MRWLEGSSLTQQFDVMGWDACADIWALGVMAYEVVAGRPALNTVDEVFDCAEGKQFYPWEVRVASLQLSLA